LKITASDEVTEFILWKQQQQQHSKPAAAAAALSLVMTKEPKDFDPNNQNSYVHAQRTSYILHGPSVISLEN